jgi:hypothetical protein
MSALAKLKPWGQLAIAALVAVCGLGVGVTAVGHAVDPRHVGLWSGPRAFFFGSLDDALIGSIRAHQLPGSTLYVVAVMVVLLCFFVSRELVGFARRGLARQPR